MRNGKALSLRDARRLLSILTQHIDWPWNSARCTVWPKEKAWQQIKDVSNVTSCDHQFPEGMATVREESLASHPGDVLLSIYLSKLGEHISLACGSNIKVCGLHSHSRFPSEKVLKVLLLGSPLMCEHRLHQSCMFKYITSWSSSKVQRPVEPRAAFRPSL